MEQIQRDSSILYAIDSVHRSLLFNNLKYEGKNKKTDGFIKNKIIEPCLIFKKIQIRLT